jgi:hypothetical protein
MNPVGESHGRADSLRPSEDELTTSHAVESRSWEPPCWPSDEWGDPAPARRRAIGWRGLRVN